MPDDEPLQKVFGERVKALRAQRGLSQEGLAERVNMHWTYISQIERGLHNISLAKAKALADALGVELTELTS